MSNVTIYMHAVLFIPTILLRFKSWARLFQWQVNDLSFGIILMLVDVTMTSIIIDLTRVVVEAVSYQSFPVVT